MKEADLVAQIDDLNHVMHSHLRDQEKMHKVTQEELEQAKKDINRPKLKRLGSKINQAQLEQLQQFKYEETQKAVEDLELSSQAYDTVI